MSKLLRAGVTSCAAILLVAMLTTPATARIECRGNFQMTQYGPMTFCCGSFRAVYRRSFSAPSKAACFRPTT